MAGDQLTIFEDAHRGGMVLDFDNSAACSVRHAVEIAPHRNHAFMTDAALDSENSLIWVRRQSQQMRSFFGEVFIDNPLCCRMDALIGNCGVCSG
ncbi:hypothetical protein LOKVESSMR4R_02498 [Yoonia vestfoldensis]|uniref:Uncharacterized protein n=1 Tax=Yoonia vestfoldensis TaxID=245188 RepID=A0A1Y0EE92_9RHOB|nr:hypothetical protein LOKVESSMR4R_02498 [Yoonia vestfoldensis]